jgi:hypothetical protein
MAGRTQDTSHGGPVHALSQKVRKLWSAAKGKSEPAAPAVIVHDPAAQRAHDLDDPFFDNNVKKRVADVITGAGRKK